MQFALNYWYGFFLESMVVVEQSQLPTSIPVTDMFGDDDLFMNIDLDHHVLPSLAATSAPPADAHLLDNDDDLIMFDLDAEVLTNLQHSDDTASAITKSTEPVDRMACNNVQLPGIVVAKPTILDPNYPYKMRNHSLVTIDQLLAIEDYADLRGCSFFIKAKIDNVYEKLRVTADKTWSLGVFLRDTSAGMLKVNTLSLLFPTSLSRYIRVFGSFRFV